MAIKVNGDTVIDDTKAITCVSIATTNGSSSEFLKADGSLDTTSYATPGKSIAMAMVFG